MALLIQMLIDTTEHDTVKLNEISLRIIMFQSWKRIYISVIAISPQEDDYNFEN